MNATDPEVWTPQAVRPPKERLEDIRKRADRAADALGELATSICDMRYACPEHPAFAEMRWWWLVTMSCRNGMADISVHAEHYARTESETTEGGEE